MHESKLPAFLSSASAHPVFGTHLGITWNERLATAFEINVRKTQLSQAQVRQSCHLDEQTETLVASIGASAIEKFPSVIINFFYHTTPSSLDGTRVVERCHNETEW